MKIIVVPKNKLKDIEDVENKILISITSGDPAITNFQEENILRLYFDDVDSEDKGRLFSIEDANKIKNFIINRDSLVDTIICSCDAGISRSSATAAALMYWINGSDMSIWNNPRYIPNRFVYRTLINQLFE